MPRVDNKLILVLIRLKIYAAQILRRYQPGVRKRCSIAGGWQPGTWLISGVVEGHGRVRQHNFHTFLFSRFTYFSGFSLRLSYSLNAGDTHHRQFSFTSTPDPYSFTNSRSTLKHRFNVSHDWAITRKIRKMIADNERFVAEKLAHLAGAAKKLDQPARHPIVSQLTTSPSFFIVDHTSEKLFTGSKFVGVAYTQKEH